MKANAEESYEEFIKDYPLKGVKLSAKFELDDSDSIAKNIYEFAIKENVSAIAVGSKGRTQAAAILIGSISEKLIKRNATIPQVVVKQRRHNMDFLEALLKL